MGQISRGGSHWSPWTVFREGTYKKFLTDVARVAAGGRPTTSPARPATRRSRPCPACRRSAPASRRARARRSPGVDLTPGFSPSDLNPFKIAGKLAGKGAGEIAEALCPLALRMAFVVGGVTLVVVGFYRGVQPTIDKARDQAKEAAAIIATKGAAA